MIDDPPTSPPSDRSPTGTTPSDSLDQLRDRLIRVAVKLVWNRDDAEELAQEAFVEAARHSLSQADARFEPWMLRTVANLCLNHRRRRRPVSLAEGLNDLCGAAASDTAERAEQLEQLRRAIERLPEQQKLALVLRTMEGMSYEDIAAVMELSTAAVRTHVHLARQRLVSRLGEQG